MRNALLFLATAFVLLAEPLGSRAQGPGAQGYGSDDPLRPFVTRRSLAERQRPYASQMPLPEPVRPPPRVTQTLQTSFPGMRSGARPNSNVPWNRGNLGRPHCTPSRYGR
jgi:hypothetical protein